VNQLRVALGPACHATRPLTAPSPLETKKAGAQASAEPWPERGPARLRAEPDARGRAALRGAPRLARGRWRGNPASPGPLETQPLGLPGIETRNREPGTPGNARPGYRNGGPIKNGGIPETRRPPGFPLEASSYPPPRRWRNLVPADSALNSWEQPFDSAVSNTRRHGP